METSPKSMPHRNILLATSHVVMIMMIMMHHSTNKQKQFLLPACHDRTKQTAVLLLRRKTIKSVEEINLRLQTTNC